MLIFPAVGSLFYFFWMLSGIVAPSFIPMDKLKFPKLLKGIVVAAAVFAGPIVPVVMLSCRGITQALKLYKDQKERLQNKRIDELKIENANGVFVAGEAYGAEENAVCMVKKFILEGLDRHASDIFFDPMPNEACLVRMRIEGVLQKITEIEASMARALCSSIKVIADMDVSEHKRPQDGSFSVLIGGEMISFRVASVGAYAGEKISIRILGKADAPSNLRSLGLSLNDYNAVDQILKQQSGMMVVCGPVGSGKASTLYALLKSIDCTTRNVMSIEESIDNVIPEISQMEINPRADMTSASLLRNALCQNPDVISLSELGDRECAEIAVQAAQTGPLIIAGVSRNDASGAVDHLNYLGIPFSTIAETVRVIISQRLVKTLCPHCKQRIALPAELESYFAQTKLPVDNVCVPAGCPQCDGTGLAGERAIFDVMVMDQQLKTLLESDSATPANVQEYIERVHGSSMMAYKAYQLVSQGVCSIDEVNRIVMNLG